ncbi:MAG: Xaa-Pro peptidase family protein [Bacillota bacterium]
MNARCGALLTAMLGREESSLDSFVISSRVNTRYFTGFTGSNSLTIVSPGGCALITDFRYVLQARQQCLADCEIIEAGRGMERAALAQQLERFRCVNTGFEDEALPVSMLHVWRDIPVNWRAASGMLKGIRAIKSEDELSLIRRAQRVSELAYSELLKRIKPGMCERDAAIELEYLIRRGGAESLSFDTIVASGENGAQCHALPSDRKFRHGDLVVLDFGSRVGGYCSDMTRTIAIGEPSKRLRSVYDIVLEAQLAALDALKPGMTGKELDASARDAIAKYGYAEYFGHGLGHGFGLEVHEAPTANPRSEDVLLPGMTITVEPGIYLPQEGGVRIEDCCALTQSGFQNLVSVPKELHIIE